MTSLSRACVAVALLVAVLVIAHSEARRGRGGSRGRGGRRGCNLIPCEINHSNGTQLYKEDCAFKDTGLFECRNKTSTDRDSRGRRRGNRRDSSEERDDL